MSKRPCILLLYILPYTHAHHLRHHKNIDKNLTRAPRKSTIVQDLAKSFKTKANKKEGKQAKRVCVAAVHAGSHAITS